MIIEVTCIEVHLLSHAYVMEQEQEQEQEQGLTSTNESDHILSVQVHSMFCSVQLVLLYITK